ncbi:hypothetical protein [Candidatus Binatus sp.]|uniref:hypothetical protein n=1 Tax=Candidatus Binatus sp. TaxID=2811406 RepID=UPI003CC5CB4A
MPAEVEGFIEDAIRRDALTAKDLSDQLFKKFRMRRGRSWLARYIQKTLRPHMVEDARLERRLRLLKRELGDRPEVLAKVAADMMSENPKPAAGRRRKKAAAR